MFTERCEVFAEGVKCLHKGYEVVIERCEDAGELSSEPRLISHVIEVSANEKCSTK